jgi:hypothetical protein
VAVAGAWTWVMVASPGPDPSPRFEPLTGRTLSQAISHVYGVNFMLTTLT